MTMVMDAVSHILVNILCPSFASKWDYLRLLLQPGGTSTSFLTLQKHLGQTDMLLCITPFLDRILLQHSNALH